MEKGKLSIDKFSWVQMVNNTEGKTSGMLFLCLISGLVGCYTFGASTTILIGAYIYSAFHKIAISEVLPNDITSLFNIMMMQGASLIVFALSGFGVRRFTNDKPINNGDEENKTV
jgi:hypothetical protein